MRVWMLIGGFYPLIGGAERQCQKLSKALIQLGIDVRVITSRLHSSWSKNEIFESVPITRLPRLLPTELDVLVWLRYLIKHRNEYDILHVHIANQEAIVAAAIIKKLFRKSMVVKFSNSGDRFDLNLIQQEKRWPLRTWMKNSVFQADRIIAICNAIKNDIIHNKVDESKIALIPNGVEISPAIKNSTKQKLRKKFKLPLNSMIILRVGSFEPKKGIDILLDAWKKVTQQNRNAFLLSVGGANLPEYLSKKIANFGDNVRFIPAQFGGMNPYYQSADLFVLPSFAEGLSNALLEAQANGLPSIVTDVGGNSDIIKNDINGIIIKSGNVDELANAILYLINSPKDRNSMKEKSLDMIADFDINKIAARYKILYQQLLNNKN